MWDYPRPPRLERSGALVRVELAGVVVAESSRSLRVLETSHPPTHYVPPEDVDWELVEPAPGSSFCEWKGSARYWTVTADGHIVEGAAWSYPAPSPTFMELKDHVAFYPARFDCTLDGEVVRPQSGGFYGGWITSRVVGPFKGEPGSMWW